MQETKQAAFIPLGLQVIRADYEKAFECLDKGLTEEKAGRWAQALELYYQGQQHLLQGIGVPTLGARCVGAAWDSARQMQGEMTEALSDVTARMTALGTVGGAATPPMLRGVPGELPPAYTPQAVDGHSSFSCGAKAGAADPPSVPKSLGEEGQQLLYLPQGVQMFFITPDGQVGAPSYPGHLRIFRRSDPLSSTAHDSAVILQVCDWVSTLTRDTPVLLCPTGVYMFSDMAASPGSYVGVVLSSELPVSDRTMFQDQLLLWTNLRIQAPDPALDPVDLSETVPLDSLDGLALTQVGEEENPAPEWSEKMAHGILTGASWLSWGLVKGAEYTEKAIHKGASKLREHITPENLPSEVNPNVTRGLQVARQATGGAVKVSQLLVDGMCSVAGCVARELTPHVKKHGGKLIPESMRKTRDGRSNIDGAMMVAASGVQGLATMWSGLEKASKNLGKSVASETVTTMKHKVKGKKHACNISSLLMFQV